MFTNEVEFEARYVSPDGVEIIVKEIASAVSDISYEDAWLKAHALAKEKAEAKLAENMKLLAGEVKEKLVYLKGERGCPGPRGPQGNSASTLPEQEGSYYGFSGTLTEESADSLNNLLSGNSRVAQSQVFRGDLKTISDIFRTFMTELPDEKSVVARDRTNESEFAVDVNQGELTELIDEISALGSGKVQALLENGWLQIKYGPESKYITSTKQPAPTPPFLTREEEIKLMIRIGAQNLAL